MKKTRFAIIFSTIMLALSGCGGIHINLLSDASEPLEEFVLEGEAREKILVIPIDGLITDKPDKGLLQTRPSIVQDVVSQLNRAKKDPDIKGLVLQINSLGGTVTASDILYHEIMRLKNERHLKITATFMDLATSGGYYVALPADRIFAHPTTITGSVGVLMIRPDITGLMDKIGVRVQIDKSGDKKDMGSLFRKTTEEEEEILQDLVDRLGKRFVDLVRKHRPMEGDALTEAASARIFLAEDALKLGLVDRIGYVRDAVEGAIELSGAPQDASIVVYRRVQYPDDNYYNPLAAYGRGPAKAADLIGLGVQDAVSLLPPGFYYVWSR